MTRRLTGWLGVAAAYLAVTADASAANLVATAVVATLLAVLLPPGRPLRLRQAPAAAWALLIHLLRLTWDVPKNGLIVARIVLGGRARPGFVAMENRQQRALASAIEAHAITLSPGQMVLGFDRRRYELHELDTSAEDDPRAVARRAEAVARIAGCKARRRAVPTPGVPGDVALSAPTPGRPGGARRG